MPKTPHAAVLLILVALILPPPAKAALGDAPRQVLVVESLSLPFLQGATHWLRSQLEELGYGDSDAIRYRLLNLEGDSEGAEERIRALVAESRPDIVITIATLASRASHSILEGSGIPQIFALVGDPVTEGFTSQIGQASGKGISGQTNVLGAETLLTQAARILERKDGGAFHIALICTSYPSSRANCNELMATQSAYPSIVFTPLAIDFHPGPDGTAAMVDQVVAQLAEAGRTLEHVGENAGEHAGKRPGDSPWDGLWIANGPTGLDSAFRQAVVARSGLPMIFGHTIAAVREGALFGLLSDEENVGRAAGLLVAKVLRGEPVAEMPISRPATFMAAINISTALRLGVTVPSELVELAGSNIFR